MIRKFLKLIIVFIISVLIGNMAYGIYKEAGINNGPTANALFENNEDDIFADEKKSKKSNDEEINQIENSELKEKTIEKLPEKYIGYKVLAKLEIPKISLDTFILEDKSDEAMWLCPVKYFGPEANEAGNYCIAAHNYDKANMFNHIIELKIGDEIFLSDNTNGRVQYEVYDIYKVKPTNNEPLTQQTNGTAEITLITCSDYSSKRIIVKARQK